MNSEVADVGSWEHPLRGDTVLRVSNCTYVEPEYVETHKFTYAIPIPAKRGAWMQWEV